MTAIRHSEEWRATLPYNIDGDGEAMLREIKQGVATAVAAADYAPGCFRWFKRLKSYLELKYPLSLDDRANFALILNELICIPEMDLNVVGFFAILLAKLIKRKEDIPSDRITLKWRPLYKRIKDLSTPKDISRVSMGSAAVAGAVASVVSRGNRFFPPEATQEILEELLPRINAHETGWLAVAKALLAMLLPTEKPPPLPESLKSTAGVAPFFWVPTLFSLWSLSRGSGPEISMFLELLSRLVEDQAPCPYNVNFSEAQVRQVFAAGLGTLQLPVGSGTNANTASGGQGGRMGSMMMNRANGGGAGGGAAAVLGQKATVDPFAGFVVWTFFPKNAPGVQFNTMTHLKEMIQAIESYYHPSNSGQWTYPLTRMLQMLGFQYLRRLRYEAQPDCPVPPEYRLTSEMSHEFVTLLRPIVFLSMFGKDQLSVHCSHAALKYFAWIQPAEVLPGLLDRVYPALETVTENHRTISCIGALTQVALPLLNRKHYPEGGAHIPALLDLVLPGIDPNDHQKTFAALNFIRQALVCIPLVDLTKSPVPAEVAAEQTIEDEECRLATAVFEDWVVRFLDRVFLVFENLPQEHGHIKSKNSLESSIIRLIKVTCHLVFMQMSPEIEGIAVRKVANFVTENVIANATKAVGSLCGMTGTPKTRLATFVPLCHKQIMTELEHGASSDSVTRSSSFPFGFAAMSDARLHWHQCILFNVVAQSGAEVLNWKKEIMEVAVASIKACKSQRGWKWAGKLIRLVVSSSSSTYPLEMRSFGSTAWKNEAFVAASHMHWGEPSDQKNLDIDWHSPNDEEKKLALEVVDELVPQALGELKRLLGEVQDGTRVGDKRVHSNEIQKWTSVLHNCLRGMTNLIGPEAPQSEVHGHSSTAKSTDVMEIDPPPGEEGSHDVEAADEEEERMRDPLSCRLPVAAGYCFEPGTPQHARVQALRDEITLYLEQASQTFRTHSEDDIESTILLIRCTITLLSNRGVPRTVYESLVHVYAYLRMMLTEGKDVPDKIVPRYVRVSKATLLHLVRLEYNAGCGPVVASQKRLVRELAEWCVSRYAVVRKEAQRAVSTVLRCFPASVRRAVLNGAVTIVASEGKQRGWLPAPAANLAEGLDAKHVADIEADRLKGALYLLKASAMVGMAVKDYQPLRKVLVALAKAYTSDKKSIQKRWVVLSKEILGRYQEIAIGLPISDDAVAASRKLVDVSTVDQGLITSSTTRAKSHAEKNRDAYNGMIVDLIHILERPGIPITYRSVLVSCVELVLREDAPVPGDVTKFALEKINSDELSLRQVSMRLLHKVMYIIKHRSKVYSPETCPAVLCTTHEMVDPQAVLNGPAKRIQSAEEWRTTVFVDDMKPGWLCWPAKVKVRRGYSGAVASDSFQFNDPESSESIQHLTTQLTSNDFWTLYFKFRSLENAGGGGGAEAATAVGSAPAERFQKSAAAVYAYACTIIGPRVLESVKPFVTQLSEAPVTDKAAQRAIMEVVAGCLAGSKYWRFEDVQTWVWTWATEIVQKGLQIADTETFALWAPVLRYGLAQRDPSRHLPLITSLLSQTLDPTSQSFFTESKKLTTARMILTTYNWRIVSPSASTSMVTESHVTLPLPLGELLKTYLAALGHPYEQVRQNLGANISAAVSAAWAIRAKDVAAVFDLSRPQVTGASGQAFMPTELDAVSRPVVGDLVRQLVTLRERLATSGEKEGTSEQGLEYKNAGMTVLSWLSNSLMSPTVASHYAYIPHLMPEVLQMQVWGDQDLQRSAQLMSQLYVNLPHPDTMVPAALDMLLRTSSLNAPAPADSTMVLSPSPSPLVRWQLRWRVLPLLQIFYFRHLFYIQSDVALRVVEGVVDLLLADPHVEVRQLASVTLAGLIRCSHRDAVMRLKKKFEKLLKSAPLPSRRRRSDASSPTSPEASETYQQTLQRRHAAVLGLNALVQAFPYEVPRDWMPDVLVTLSMCVGDPVPVGSAVQKLFAEFKRTHQDNWHEDLEAFDEDQRERLADLLISPSYYA
ncbi:uncharacterized protein EV422DRAFT_538673 [Fimicolochytrium jonesii]|uniref:uncharacterized protein n=1 Tax=Fimicolochytrium jonesii TaxID=1396493 RepID=UPI0022FDD449|nr:uncharacterized protein EV422DRAFT_538673 [Fimicolochytrium jonesii]KAI8818081.1 hypothetical protein EV422DRAFT_538673 [Fimicolochytrium jonesii]